MDFEPGSVTWLLCILQLAFLNITGMVSQDEASEALDSNLKFERYQKSVVTIIK
jgi:hypothetical protein